MKALQGIVAAAMIFGAGCITPMELPMEASSSLPASEGVALVSEGPNGNTALRVKVKHLAYPQRITQGAEVYVVWVTPHDGGRPQNVGVMMIDKDLEGTLNTVTPLKNFKVTVTPETSGQVQVPTNEPVFIADVHQ
jgi:hypothetical protein